MASRKEQKEALRQERLAREQAAKAAQRRKQMVGYGVGGALALAAVVIVAVLLLSGGDDGGGGGGSNEAVYPDGVEIADPGPLSNNVAKAARAADCELQENAATSRDHITDPNETEDYAQKPPTSGRHYAVPAEDGIYDEAPDKEDLVHTLEHGRVIVWFKPNAPAEARGSIKTLFDEDPYQMVVVPYEDMPFQVAATAWNIDPTPEGTGRLMGCPRWNDDVVDALRAFRNENRGNGPEPIP